MDWYKLFRQHILDRGIEYFEDGEVTEFSYSNNEIKASVNGSDVYEVEISLDEEDVIDMYCSCPYAAGGNNCKHMAEIADEDFKNQMKLWFESHRTGFVLDFMDEYIEEILFECFATKEMIEGEIQKLDEIINKSSGNDCGRYYSIYRGCENPILKRIEYMKKLNCTEAEIAEYRKNNRRFFIVRELEISEAIDEGNYEKAIEVLLESKRLDTGNKNHLEKYSKQLIDIYKKLGAIELFCEETIFYLESFGQYDLTYVNVLKPYIKDEEEWNKIIDGVVEKNTHGDFVCNLLSAEKRYEQLLSKIENSFDKVRLLDVHEKVLRKNYPDRVIKIYKDYLKQAAEMANQREKYRGLMVYLKKISKCIGGDEIAKAIAEDWRRLYKRRTAMMDELRKIGF